MRDSCIDCVLKHIVSAHILLHEAKLGYPDHVYIAIGHLAQAEVELASKHLDVARELRVIRKRIEEEEDADLDVLEWIQKLVALDDTGMDYHPFVHAVEANAGPENVPTAANIDEPAKEIRIPPEVLEPIRQAIKDAMHYISRPYMIISDTPMTVNEIRGKAGRPPIVQDDGDIDWDENLIEPDRDEPRKSLWQAFRDWYTWKPTQ